MMKVGPAHSLVGKGQGVCQQKSAQYNHANLLPVKRKARLYMSLEKCIAKTRPTHPLKKVGSAYVSPKESTQKLGLLTICKVWPECMF